MSSHQIQFQHGMSIPEFLSHFGTEAQCAVALKRSRWPQGLRCPRFINMQHYLVVHGRAVGTLKPRDLPEFKWVNTVLGNLKTMLASAYKALKFRKYAQTYLGAFACRLNHRFDLREMIATLIFDVARTKPMPENGSEAGLLRHVSNQLIICAE